MTKEIANQREKYYLIPSYTMKCRLLPNKNCAQKIDDAIKAVKVYHNDLLYNTFFGGEEYDYLRTPKAYKPKKSEKLPEKREGETEQEYAERMYAYEQKQNFKEGDTIHFANINAGFTKEFKQDFATRHPYLWGACISSSLTCKSGLQADMKKALGNLPIEFTKARFYNDGNHQRRSISYQEGLSKISTKGNKNVIYITLAKIGTVKIRGWNQNIRFDESHEQDFLSYCENNRKKRVTVTLKKDPCGDYWICFKLANVYKLMPEASEKKVGVHLGLTKLAYTSDGTEYESMKFKKEQSGLQKKLNRKLSRRWGYSNIKFRNKRDKKENNIVPSKRYMRTKLKKAKLERQIADKRKLYNNVLSTQLIKDFGFIATETLNVRKMLLDKKFSYPASDNALYMLLNMIDYKAEWYEREHEVIDEFSPIVKTCNVCGTINEDLPDSAKKWTCPGCGEKHERGINAAINILNLGLLKSEKKETAD